MATSTMQNEETVILEAKAKYLTGMPASGIVTLTNKRVVWSKKGNIVNNLAFSVMSLAAKNEMNVPFEEINSIEAVKSFGQICIDIRTNTTTKTGELTLHRIALISSKKSRNATKSLTTYKDQSHARVRRCFDFHNIESIKPCLNN